MALYNTTKSIFKEKHTSLLTKCLHFKQGVVGVWLNLRELTVLWWFNDSPDSNLEVMGLQHHQSEGGMNNFVTEAASVIKRKVTQEEQVLPKRP